MMNTEGGLIFYHPPHFPNILKRNGGIFPDSTDEEMMRSYAAWYIATCCHLSILTLEGQVSLEGSTDVTASLRTITDNIYPTYGIKDVNEVMNLMPLCRRWAFKNGRTWNDKFQAWLDSGGRAYDEVTRDPGAI